MTRKFTESEKLRLGPAGIIVLLLTLVSAIGTLLLLFPMPVYWLWLASAAVDELSLWVLVAAAIGVCVAAFGWFRVVGNRKLKIFFLCSTVLCLICALQVVALMVQIFNVARTENVPLSFAEYLFGMSQRPEEVTRYRGVTFSQKHANPLKVDIYQPAAHAGQLPVVIVIHGGSWSRGHRSEYEKFDLWLAQNGYAVFDTDYRLANSDARFPSQIEDIKMLLQWIGDNEKKYDVDVNRVALLGRSSGAELALVTSYTSRASGRDSQIRCVVSYYAPTDLRWDYSNPGKPDIIDTQRTLENYLGGPPDSMHRKQYHDASPTELVSASSPATFVIQGCHDQVVCTENALFLESKLRTAKVPVKLLLLPGANHGFDWNFNGWNSQISRNKVLQFLQAYMQ